MSECSFTRLLELANLQLSIALIERVTHFANQRIGLLQRRIRTQGHRGKAKCRPQLSASVSVARGLDRFSMLFHE
jgi:hypothetical protein